MPRIDKNYFPFGLQMQWREGQGRIRIAKLHGKYVNEREK